MTDEIRQYAKEQLRKNDINIVPGHHPDFRDKAHVDRWIGMIKAIFDTAWEDGEE